MTVVLLILLKLSENNIFCVDGRIKNRVTCFVLMELNKEWCLMFCVDGVE